MKEKYRKWVLYLCLHLVVSGVIWGGMRVHQRGYNMLHSEQIAMANVTTTQSFTEITVLQRSFRIPRSWFAEDSPLYFAAYALTGEDVHLWLYLSEALGEMLE